MGNFVFVGELVLHGPGEGVKLKVVTAYPGRVHLRIPENEELRSSAGCFQNWSRSWLDGAISRGACVLGSSPLRPALPLAAVHSRAGEKDMRDLTVARIHTYYVIAGTTPVLVHNCEFSDRASEIHAAEPDQYVRDNISTVAVVRARTPHGDVDIVAGSGDGLTPAEMSVPLRPGEMHAPNIPGTHAEQNAFLFINEQGWTPIAGGTSRNVCLSTCAPWIRGTGGRMMGNVYPGSGVTTTRQRSFEW